MNETSIKPISSVHPSETGTPAKLPATNPPDTTATRKPVVAEPDVPAKQIEIHSEQQDERPSNVSIHFRLDDETNELTIFVVDRKTKRVLRSIPASELHKLQAGDLLKLTA